MAADFGFEILQPDGIQDGQVRWRSAKRTLKLVLRIVIEGGVEY